MKLNDMKNGLFTVVTLLKVILALLVVALVFYVVHSIRTAETPLVEITTDNPEFKLSLSPEQIQKIEDIGEWVFLTVEVEELVDTVRKNLILSDDVLSRIYAGTLHYGINLKENRNKKWLYCHGDTLTAYLPAVKLMDRRFINEAQTRTFYQEGKWDNKALQALYNKAQRTMMKTYHTQKNVNQALESGKARMTEFFKAYGFATVEVFFDNSPQ